jgi:hypothetical protein
MTAFTIAQLPTGDREIETIEELVAWAGEILLTRNAKEQIVRVSGQPAEPRFQFARGVDSDSVQHIQVVAILRYDTTKAGLSLPAWKQVKEDATAPTPASFSDIP